MSGFPNMLKGSHATMNRNFSRICKVTGNIAASTRTFSFRNSSNDSFMNTANPSYQVYGEEAALTIRALPPEFKQLNNGMVVLNNSISSRGRLMLEWTPRDYQTGRYQWASSSSGHNNITQPIRFALTPEEAASVFLAKLDPQKSIIRCLESDSNNESEVNTIAVAEVIRRQMSGGGTRGLYTDMQNNDNPGMEKIFRAKLLSDGSAVLKVDYETDGIGGQDSYTEQEAKGPLEVHLMVGEFHVLRALIEHTIPRLTGWAFMLDHSIEHAIRKSSKGPSDSFPYTHQGQKRQGGNSSVGENEELPF